MLNLAARRLAAGIGLCLWAVPAAAQVDYRHLDAGRPVRVGDAYPLERFGFEVSLPWTVVREAGSTGHEFAPHLEFGAARNLVVGLGADLRAGGGRELRLGRLEAGALWNFRRETPGLPALSVTASAAAPGAGGPGRGTLGAGLAATRSFDAWRVHLNAATRLLGPDSTGGDTGPRWWAGMALDRALIRSSTLLVAEMTVERDAPGVPLWWRLGGGLRRQVAPTWILHGGVATGLDNGHGLEVNLGLSHLFGTAGTSARGVGPDRPPRGRDEEFYYPGAFNWSFRRVYPDAARLFNAFDYGHAVLYERLFANPADVTSLETTEYDFLTADLLVRPPRFAVAEEAVMPRYGRAAWRAQLMFDRAHILHRQIYDVYADDRIPSTEKVALVERLTDHYLAGRYAFTDQPKEMVLMDGQPYSLDFKRRFPKFNGLIWAYHWLQVGLYEAMVTEETADGRRTAVDQSVARFRAMLVAPPSRLPDVMPMTSAVAPVFSERHPRAAVIFDNLHMMHDIISDILASNRVPARDKMRTIDAALDEFQRGDQNVTSMEHWRMMADHMGGVDRMGGRAGRPRP